MFTKAIAAVVLLGAAVVSGNAVFQEIGCPIQYFCSGSSVCPIQRLCCPDADRPAKSSCCSAEATPPPSCCTPAGDDCCDAN